MHREHPLEDYEFDWRCEHCEKGFHDKKNYCYIYNMYTMEQTKFADTSWKEIVFLEMNVGTAIKKIQKLKKLSARFVIAVLTANLS